MFNHVYIIVWVLLIHHTSCFSVGNSNKWKKTIPFLDQEDGSKVPNDRRKQKLDGKIPVLSRTVPLGINEIPYVTIWELQNPSKLMEIWWAADLDSASSVSKEKIGDPFGVVFWPGSILASKVLYDHKEEVSNSTVLILGAGTGVEAQASAMIGAKRVIATDISKLTLKLLKYGAEQAGLGDIIEPLQFDLYSNERLPECDIMVAADVLYNEELANQIGKRCVEVLSRPNPPKLVITDSQRFHGTDFLADVNEQLSKIGKELQWDYFLLQNVTGSGVMIEGDQTYDAKTRLVSDGWST
jgi:predicted nicotinamide N-methyase